jgi:hypothetical protein
VVCLQTHPLIVKVYVLVRDIELSLFALGTTGGDLRDFALRTGRRKLLRAALTG